MTRSTNIDHAVAVALFALAIGPTTAQAQSRVQYGRITNVATTTVDSSTAQNVAPSSAALIGLASGGGQSGSNRALRTIGGAAAGRGVGTLATRAQAFEYTVLIGGADDHPRRLRPGRQAGRRLRRRRAGAVRQHPPRSGLALRAPRAPRPAPRAGTPRCRPAPEGGQRLRTGQATGAERRDRRGLHAGGAPHAPAVRRVGRVPRIAQTPFFDSVEKTEHDAARHRRLLLDLRDDDARRSRPCSPRACRRRAAGRRHRSRARARGPGRAAVARSCCARGRGWRRVRHR